MEQGVRLALAALLDRAVSEVVMERVMRKVTQVHPEHPVRQGVQVLQEMF